VRENFTKNLNKEFKKNIKGFENTIKSFFSSKNYGSGSYSKVILTK
jgi:hypothetical protein